MKLWNPTLRINDSLWYIPVRWDRYDWNECSVRVKCDFHKLCFHKYFVNIVHCSILLRSDNCVHVNVPYTAYPRYHITSQRVPLCITTVEDTISWTSENTFFKYFGMPSWHAKIVIADICPRLFVRNVCWACLQQVCYNRVRK